MTEKNKGMPLVGEDLVFAVIPKAANLGTSTEDIAKMRVFSKFDDPEKFVKAVLNLHNQKRHKEMHLLAAAVDDVDRDKIASLIEEKVN